MSKGFVIKSFVSTEELASFLGISHAKLLYLTRNPTPKDLYHCFDIPKSNGEPRRIMAPRYDLKIIQKKLADWLTPYYSAPSCVHGFQKEHSIVTNAMPHIKRQVVVSIDIKDFFPSISPSRVWGLLVKPPFSLTRKVAFAISRLLCFQGGLPQGSPASPIVSNMICRSLDRNLMAYAKKYRAYYTRYADDLTFSFGNRNTFKKLFFTDFEEFEIPSELRNIIESHNGNKSFCINEMKTRYRYCSARQEVTGITVNQKTNLTRKHYRFLRSALFHWEKFGLSSAAGTYFKTQQPTEYQQKIYEDVIRGKLAYYKMVLGRNATASSPLMKLGTRFNRLHPSPLFPIHDPTDSLFRITLEHANGEDILEGTAFLLQSVGLITAKHIFADAKKEEDGSYITFFWSLFNQSQEQCRITLNENRNNPQYDYIAISCQEAPTSLLAGVAPLTRASLPQLRGKEMKSYELYSDDGALFQRNISGKVKQEGKCPNQYGSLAKVSCSFHHGMSGGPVLNDQNEVVGIVNSGSDEGMVSKYLLIGSLHNYEYEQVTWI